MSYASYKENIRKITEAKDNHVDAIETTISATKKFLLSRENFWNHNSEALQDVLLVTSQMEKFSPTLAANASFLLSKDTNDPVGYEDICVFLEKSFIPVLYEINLMYKTSFDAEFEKLKPFIEKLEKAEETMNFEESNLTKACDELETLNKNKGSKKQEEKFNDLAFEYKNIRQKAISSISAFNKDMKEYMNACESFFSGFEAVDRCRSEQMQNLFETMQSLIKRTYFTEDKENSLEKIAEKIKNSENMISANKIEKTQLPHEAPIVDLDFPYSEFLDFNAVFSQILAQKYALAKCEIKKSKAVLAQEGDKVIIRSINEETALISNLEDSLRLAVPIDMLDMRPEFERYLATVKNGPNNGHVVCVVQSGDICEVLTEWGYPDLINSSDLY